MRQIIHIHPRKFLATAPGCHRGPLQTFITFRIKNDRVGDQVIADKSCSSSASITIDRIVSETSLGKGVGL